MKTKLQIAIDALKAIEYIGFETCELSYYNIAKNALQEIERAPYELTMEQDLQAMQEWSEDFLQHPELHQRFINQYNQMLDDINNSYQKEEDPHDHN